MKDVDFDYRQILLRDGKGAKDRVLAVAKAMHEADLPPDAGRSSSPTLLGHADVSTTMVYTQVLNKGGRGVESPLDATAAGSIRP